MDLTQRTHGRLLAALSFNNRYPSPSSSSPSISSVRRDSALFVCSGLFLLAFYFFFHPFLSFTSSLSLSIFSNTFQMPLPDFHWLLFLLKFLFISPSQPGSHTVPLFNLFLFRSALLLLFSSLHRCVCWSNPRQRIL